MADHALGAVAALPSDQDVELLRTRLAEAEAALHAIISGQVDAVAAPDTAAPVLLQHAQDALRRSEERYRDLIARSPAIVCELAADSTTRYVNAAVTALLGYEPADLLGKPWWATLCPDRPPAEVIALTRRFAAGSVADLELDVRSRSGESRKVVWNSTTRCTADGAFEAVVAFGLDISERKRAEENAYRLAAEQTARAVAEVAEQRAALLAGASRVLDSSLDYEATLASVAGLVVPVLGDWCAVDMLGPDGTLRRIAIRHEDAGKVARVAALDRLHPPDPEATRGVLTVMRTGVAELYPDLGETIGTAADEGGPLGDLQKLGLKSAIIVPLTTRDRAIGAITLVTAESGRRYDEGDLRMAEDLAQRAGVAIERARLYQEASAARAEAEEANQAKSQFLASMSHELRTPLNAIGGYVQLLEDGISGPVNDQQRDYLRRTRRSQEHLLGLINDVLNFAKLEAGAVQFELTEFALRETLSEVDDLTAPQVGAKGLQYENTGCQTTIMVRADRDKLRQILLNLVSNAVKFTPAGGRITVECRASGRDASITVRDTGIGIPADKVEAVFEPFVQVGAQLNREGTGLGLSISRELARAMQGDLSATSVLGEGSAFTVTVPRVSAAVKHPSQ